MIDIALPKAQYSEAVVRKSLYWVSEHSAWELRDTANDWLVTIHDPDEFPKSELYRLLNDFLLREEIDRSTKLLRTEVVEAALLKLSK